MTTYYAPLNRTITRHNISQKDIVKIEQLNNDVLVLRTNNINYVTTHVIECRSIKTSVKVIDYYFPTQDQIDCYLRVVDQESMFDFFVFF